jgi:DNA-damage-inducible protein J
MPHFPRHFVRFAKLCQNCGLVLYSHIFLTFIYYMNDNVIHGRYKMPANSLVQTRINSVIKEEASIVLQAIGLTVSDAVRLMLTRVAREKALPFEPLIPNEATIAAMKEAREGKLETVTLDDLQAVFNANDQTDNSL